ncbi:MAG TPA: SCO1664 family protein [Nocardioidaceae bacterium]|nr:SCO1664 family protein [Nocardioidaceae bacterium]
MPEPVNAAERADEPAVLADGDLELKGRVLPASNLTFFGEAMLDGASLRCVYKPVSGERPLWDFPDGTLAAREVAARTVSEALGWDVVPLTILREGPFGVGMVQVWREPDPAQDPVDIVPAGQVPDGYLHVLDAVDAGDEPVSLVHEDSRPLRRMAVFDAVVNNADRKGGHVLAMSDGHRYGVDHGVSFHVDNKLRTVLWGWAGEPLHRDDVEALTVFTGALETPGSGPATALSELLDAAEVAALLRRCRRLLAAGRMPLPSAEWPAIPWPAF